MKYTRSKEHFSNIPQVNLQDNSQSKENQTCTNRFYGYPDSALSALLAAGLVILVLLSSFVRCPLAVRIEGRVVSVLTLRIGRTALRNERTTVLFLLLVLTLVCSIHCELLSTIVPPRIVIQILQAAHLTKLCQW